MRAPGILLAREQAKTSAISIPSRPRVTKAQGQPRSYAQLCLPQRRRRFVTSMAVGDVTIEKAAPRFEAKSNLTGSRFCTPLRKGRKPTKPERLRRRGQLFAFPLKSDRFGSYKKPFLAAAFDTLYKEGLLRGLKPGTKCIPSLSRGGSGSSWWLFSCSLRKARGHRGTRGGCLACSSLVVAIGTVLCIPGDSRHV